MKNLKTNHPIGIFDSGIGGTSIYKAIIERLPHENTIYLADSKHAPYGPKGKKKIIELSEHNTEFLLEQGAKLIVVACNTATTNAIKELRARYEVPFIGIEPAIKPAALNTHTQKVGVLATEGTLSSELFQQTSQQFRQNIQIIEQVGEGLVERIEAGDLSSPELRSLLLSFVQPMVDEGIDYLVLGCTHYPYLMPLLEEIVPQNIEIIDSGQAVARQTEAVLKQQHLLNPSKELGWHKFFTTGRHPEIMAKILGGGEHVEPLCL